MIEVIVERTLINPPMLDTALRETLGNLTTGFSAGNGVVIVYLDDSATLDQQEQAREIVLAHDPTQLTPEQQAEAARAQKLAQYQTQYGAANLDLTAYDAQSEQIRQLAEKIAWLEQEVLAGRR